MMEKLIHIVSELQEIYRRLGVEHKGFDLPQVVVLGAQSSGKSSTLEALIGKEFLPRGEGIVTRRPLHLELVNVSKEQQSKKNVGTFQTICEDPIMLKIYSPDVTNLTLIDLPGLTMVPVSGQSTDIPQQLENLALKYVTNPKSIILAVHQANLDAANCFGLKVAKIADPTGERTIAVITKLDKITDRGKIIQLLAGDLYEQNLLGIIGVYNRTTDDGNIFTFQDAKEREETYMYQTFPPEIAAKQGISYLANTLSRVLRRILINHIVESLPEIKNAIDSEIYFQEMELQHLGQPPLNSEYEAGIKLTAILDSFTRNFSNIIDGVHLLSMDGGR